MPKLGKDSPRFTLRHLSSGINVMYDKEMDELGNYGKQMLKEPPTS